METLQVIPQRNTQRLESYRSMQRPTLEERRKREQKRKIMKRKRRIQKIKRNLQLVCMLALLVVSCKLLWEVGLEEIFHGEKLLGGRSSVFTDAERNSGQYPEELLTALEKNPELEEFVKGFPDSDGSVTGGLTEEELSLEFPLLLQYDKRWGYAPYGENFIALSGCGPTCLSMVIVALTRNEEATPDAVAKYAMKKGYYMEGVGTAWSLMSEGGKKYGITGQEIGLDEKIVFSKLESGQPIICSMRPGDFTETGHFIVLTGVEDGRIRVNDPYSKERSGKLWEYETLQYQIKNLWAYTNR